MELKRVIYTVAVSIPIMMISFFLIYGMDLSVMHLSNVIFLMGMFFFFPGVISVTGAMEVFESSGYLTRKVFGKNSENDFKTLGEYKAYKKLNKQQSSIKGRGYTLLIVGGAYIILSLVMTL